MQKVGKFAASIEHPITTSVSVLNHLTTGFVLGPQWGSAALATAPVSPPPC